MTTNMSKKIWAQPAITSVERMKDAAGGNGSGVRKGSDSIEYLYNGPGS